MKVYTDANPTMVACVPEDKMRQQPILQPLYPARTNNEAEYLAILIALEHFTNVTEILSDSQLVINQLNHMFHIKEDRLRNLAIKVWSLTKGSVIFTWVPRKDNLAGKMLK